MHTHQTCILLFFVLNFFLLLLPQTEYVRANKIIDDREKKKEIINLLTNNQDRKGKKSQSSVYVYVRRDERTKSEKN